MRRTAPSPGHSRPNEGEAACVVWVPANSKATISVARTPFRGTFIVPSPLARNLSRGRSRASARHREGDRLDDGLVGAALDVAHRDANGVGADGNRRGVPEEARGAIVSGQAVGLAKFLVGEDGRARAA